MTDVVNPKSASPDQLLPYHKKISAEGKALMICFISDTYMVLKAAGRLAFNILFWSGIREGELLALTRNDFIRRGADEYRLNVNKNFEVVKGTRYILTPKTDSSNRCITIPQFLYYEAVQYFDSLY